ncbi:hypothetical protein [Neorhizobium sp. T7_12]|uniref:hypothetical protein n=1 Tax=Neorhizobium sp. T7_12 TaxID=2093832 RepID=UPI001FE04F01|nr:hypothetical protein [Neorhizobium sp. T7_12]
MNRRTLLQMLAGLAASEPFNGFSFGQASAREDYPSRLGVNLSPMNYWATEQVFSDLAYNASRWRVQIKGAPFTWDTPLPPMTPDGYPLNVPANSTLETFLIFSRERRNLPVNLSVYYDGKGKLGYRDGAELELRLPGRDDVRNLRKDAAFTTIMMETDPSDPVRNIRVYERGKRPTQRFREPFLKRLKRMSTLRFMDWMATNNSTVRSWDDRPRVGHFGKSDAGTPLEHMIELSNELQIDPWFNMPHQADDDYIRRFAQQVKDGLDGNLVVNVEYSNEVWNSGFGQAEYAKEKGLALGLSSNEFEAQLRYYAQRTTEILAIWKDVFRGQAQRIVGIYSAQSVNDWTSETILSWKGVQAHADVLAIAPYFGGSLGSPERTEQISRWPLAQLFTELERDVLNDNRKMIETQASVARKYGVKLYAYEGGQHLVGHSGAENNERLTNLFIAANRDRRMGELYLLHLNIWQRSGGDAYALYSSMTDASKWGSWGLLENESDSNPKWLAIEKILMRRELQSESGSVRIAR